MRASRLVLILALGLVAGCKDCDDNPVGPSGPTMSLSLNTDTLRLEVGSTAAVTATTEGADQVAWSSPNPAIVSLSVSGKSATVMAVSAGIGRVIARLQADQNKVDTVIVVVSAKPVVPQVRGITISPASHTMKVGQKFTPTPVVTADAGVSTTWRCISMNVAVVAVNPTTCEITAFGLSPLNGVSPVQVIAVSDAVHPTLGKLEAGMNVFVVP